MHLVLVNRLAERNKLRKRLEDRLSHLEELFARGSEGLQSMHETEADGGVEKTG